MGSKPIGISASRGAGILGLSKYNTPISVWLKIMEAREPGFIEKRGYKTPEFEYSAAMELGHLFEDAIIEQAERIQGDEIKQREALYQCQPLDYITCHIDGMYVAKKCLHEGKTAVFFVYRDDWGEPGTDEIPQDYQVQVQHQMLATGAERAIVSVLVLPMRQDDIVAATPADMIDIAAWMRTLVQMGNYHQYVVPRNNEAIELMRDKYVDFWEQNVLFKVPPEIQNYDDILRIFTNPKGTIVADPQIEMLSAEYKAYTKEEGQIRKQKSELKTRLIKWAREEGMRNGLNIDSDSLKSLRIKSRDGFGLHSYNGKSFR